MKSNIIFQTLFTAIFFFIPTLIFAQGDPEAVPIDGGLSLLVAAGIGYGVKKALKSKKEGNTF